MLDTGKLGSLREIERTDLRSVLHFMREYFQMKQESQPVNTKYVYGDQVDWA